MSFLWLIIGVLLGVGAFYLYSAKRDQITTLDWVLVALWVVLVLFTVALVTTFMGELYAGAGRAAMVSALIFGGLAVVTGVLLFRKVFAGK